MRLWAFLFFLLPLTCLAQYPNNWVQYNQQYYKISVATTGIYRLTYEQLQQAGVPVTSMDPRFIQVFHRGVEQAITFKDNQIPANGQFEAGEYLEFYGHKNDGELDSKLYQPASVQPHKYYNLFSDTTAYFLTVNPFATPGKRMASFDEVNTSGIPRQTSQTAEQLRLFTAEYSVGVLENDFTHQTFFDQGEGWTGQTICTVNTQCIGNEQRDYPIDQLSNVITSQPPPSLEIQLTGGEDLAHQVEVYVGANTASLRLLVTKAFNDYETPIYTQSLNWSDIGGDGKMVVRVRALGVGGIRDRFSVNYIKIRFAQGFSFGGASTRVMELNAGAAKSYIEMDNTQSGTRLWDITDLNNISTIGTRTSGSLLTAVVNNTTQSRKLYASSVFMVPDVKQIKPVRFRELNPASEYLIVTHRSLMQPAGGYSDPVRAFAEYRASDIGGGYDTLVVTVDQLYDQFNYGETSPTAIYEFMRYMVMQGDPHYVFFIGKGRDARDDAHRRTLAPTESKDLVPPAGYPSSDIAYSAGLKGEPYVPAVATGRITASTPLQVAYYLNKVKETDAIPLTELWRKKILHLSGGIQPSELVRFRQHMAGFENIAKGDYLGGSVATMGKHGTDPVEFINISEQVNGGVDLVTFFGHSAPNATDVDIGFVSNAILGYNNPGKYPVLLVNGCNAGEYFNNGESFGEDWILTPNKGARNFIANSSFGFEQSLVDYTNYFYRIGFGDSLFIGKGVGDVQRELASQFIRDFTSTKSMYTALVQQMVLLGDPAVPLFAADHPDFSTSSSMIEVVSFDGKPIHALSDSLELRIITNNLGRTTKGDVEVKILHTINNTTVEYNKYFSSPRFTDTLRFTISRGSGNFYGNNTIEVIIDPSNKIAELNEQNNSGEWSKFILFNGTQNLQPGNFGIVANTSVDFLFQDTDVLSAEKTYNIQLDTSRLFNSPFLQTKNVTGKILLKATFNLLDADSTAYYWRTKPSDKTEDEWETTTFSYIKNGPNGWTQLVFDQMLSNSFNGLVADEPNKKFRYESTSVSINVKTYGNLNTTPGITPSVLVDNAEYYYGGSCRHNTLNLIAFDRSTVVPYLGVSYAFAVSGGRACGREPQLINSYLASETQTGQNDDLIQYIDNLKQGDSVVLFTVDNPDFASYPAAVKTKLGEIGIATTDLNNFIPGEPIIILGRKGASPGQAKIIRSAEANPQQSELSINEDITGFLTKGSLTSVIIGPAAAWHNVTPKFKLIDASDEASVDVYRVDKFGNEVLYSFGIQGALSLEDINAIDYPYLKLVYRTTDEVLLTPAKLNNWLVSYDPVPDGLLLPAPGLKPVTVNEGVNHTASFAFINISNVSFTDSLTSVYTVLNQNTRLKERHEFRIKGPAVGDTTTFSQTISTLGKTGLNDLTAAVNTGLVNEQYYQNNSVELSSYLNVLKDSFNPVLQVTIDGRFVSNGDFVSANPLIRITLRDENTLRVLKDTTSLEVFMAYPCDTDNCTFKRIAFSRTDVKWRINSDGVLEVDFKPVNLQEGTYTLQVTGKDASGNPSGSDPYKVSFVVEHDTGLIFYDPYPNPSSTGFYFDFTAAGDVAPNGFALSIIDRQGRDIAHFTEQDNAALRVGMNQLRWTGADAQGNRLSEGLYFYLLTIKSGDQTFKKSGRLMIVR